MNAAARILKSVNYNIVLYAVAAVVLLYGLTSPRVTDPILNFCFAGIIPGTDRVVAPDVVIMSLTVILGLTMTTVLIIWLVKSISSRRQKMLAPVTTVEKIIFSREAEQKPIKRQRAAARVRVVPAKQVTIAAVSTFVSPIASGFVEVFVSVFAVLALLFRAMRVTILAMGRGLLTGVKKLIIACIAITTLLARLFVAVLRYVGTTARILGRFMYPYAVRLDTRLELSCRAVLAFSRRNFMKYEAVQVGMVMIRETRASIKHLLK